MDERLVAHTCDEHECAVVRPRRFFVRQAFGCAGAIAGTALFGIDLPFLGEAVIAEAQGSERRYGIPASDGVVIDAATSVMLARFQSKVFALSMVCPHQNAAVRWLPKEQRFRCSKHDSKYQPNGTYTSGRATRNLDRFPIRRDADSVIVDVTRVFKSDQDATAWTNAAVTL